MPRSLADGHIKLAILTTKPIDVTSPTVTELNAGIGGSAGAGCRILLSDWSNGPTDSETFNDRAVCEDQNVNAYGANNFAGGMTVFRYFNETGVPDALEDALFEAAKAKGSTLYVYERQTGQDESVPWTAGDELWAGGEWLTDNPQRPSDQGGYVKRRIPVQVQKGYMNAVVGAGV